MFFRHFSLRIEDCGNNFLAGSLRKRERKAKAGLRIRMMRYVLIDTLYEKGMGY